jgi:NarL family two-component system response regulator LiaR
VTEDGFDVVGEASDGDEAVRLADQLRPDVILMDVTMPDVDGVEATRRISAAHPEIRIVMLTMHADQR